MSGTPTLSERIKAEFDAQAQRQQADERKRLEQQKEHESQVEQFNRICEDLKSIWRPRLEDFAKQLGDRVKVTPKVDPEHRRAIVDFNTELANVTLELSASCDSEVTKLVLDYDLRIIPVFFDYERNARLEMPLDKIDRDAIGTWIDDRLVSCVKVFLSLRDNEHYVRRAMVEDPITKERFLREDAAATLEHHNRTVYFKSEESLQKYKEKHQIDQVPAAQAPPAVEVVATTGAAARPVSPASTAPARSGIGRNRNDDKQRDSHRIASRRDGWLPLEFPVAVCPRPAVPSTYDHSDSRMPRSAPSVVPSPLRSASGVPHAARSRPRSPPSTTPSPLRSAGLGGLTGWPQSTPLPLVIVYSSIGAMPW